MNRDLKIWGVILGIVVMGAGITSINQSYMGSAYRTMQEKDGEAVSGQADFADAAFPASLAGKSLSLEEEGGPDYRACLAGYLERLAEVDSRIERMRSLETENTLQAVKSSVLAEQGIWERELDTVYGILVESLDEPESSILRASQQKWIEERDTKAREASGKSSGISLESVEYSASIAASTRDRVYELVKQYQ